MIQRRSAWQIALRIYYVVQRCYDIHYPLLYFWRKHCKHKVVKDGPGWFVKKKVFSHIQ